MNINNFVDQIINFHQQAIVRWKQTGVQTEAKDFMATVEANHLYNFKLWHAEDRARRTDMGNDYIVLAKREIDACNQQRNNQMEKIDEFIIQSFEPASYENCKVHSETPGMMIDRLSILALKIYHMHLQTIRTDVDDQHILQCQQKLNQLNLQRQQLSICLKELLTELVNKTRTFRVYQQHKMYNDPNLNPELYASRSTT